MGLLSWFKDLFKKEDEDVHLEVRCPKCGSTKIGYFTGLANYVQVIQDKEEPKYQQTARCENCGYSVRSEIDDMSDDYLEGWICKQ